MSSILAKLGDLIALPAEGEPTDPTRSSYERFAIPYSFKPRLSLAEAAVSAAGALARIFLGSMLFALWGTFSFVAWRTIHNIVLRILAVAGLTALFVVLMALLMLAISALVKRVWPRRPPRSSS